MKKILYPFLLLIAFQIKAQHVLPHQSQAPPVNPNGIFMRGLMIDCTDRIIDDMILNNVNGLKLRLENYLRDNFINYAAMQGLENVLGDATKETALKQLLSELHLLIPNLEIAAVGSSTALFNNSFFRNRQLFMPNCNETKFQRVLSVKDVSETAASLMNFFDLAARFNRKSVQSESKTCEDGFDALYLDYPYWLSTADITAAQNAFESYRTVLVFMEQLRCVNSCIRYSDASFWPVSDFTTQGWTATDQITAVDTLISRVILTGYTNDANGVFHANCFSYHLFADRFTKDRSRIFIGMNAGSSRFAQCNGGIVDDFLGDYLDYFGNMYSLEKILMDQMNDPSFICPQCNCNTNNADRYTGVNKPGNEFMGAMWFSYSFMENQQLYRTVQPLKKYIPTDTLGRQHY